MSVSPWQTIVNGWNNLEIEYLSGNLSGKMNLYLSGTKVQSIDPIDTDTLSIDSVRLGAMGVETGTRGSVFFDDYQSRRFSAIGPLLDPGLLEQNPSLVPDWVNKTYSYEDGAHKHAVTSVVVTDENNVQTTNTYRYDANGNMTCRIEGGQTFLQTFNAENRMSGVALVTGNCDTLGDTLKTWIFTYDGDGQKVKQVYTEGASTLTTYYYAGGSYEVQTDGTTETARQYYSIAGMTVAMKVGAYGDTPAEWVFFLTDHLGSVVGVTDATGTLVSETRYLPFGEVRLSVGAITQTDFGYTFQRNNSYIKLLDYRFRSYSPDLGRFISPDSIIPNLSNPQSLNRYSYVNNRPINFNDPSGHKETCGEYGQQCPKNQEKNYQKDIFDRYKINLMSGGWTYDESAYIYSALSRMESGLNNITNGRGLPWIRNNLGGAIISVGFDQDNFTNLLAFGSFPGIGANPHVIANSVFLPSSFTSVNWSSPYGRADTMIVHEFGHVVDNRSSISGLGSIFGGGGGDGLMRFVGSTPTGIFGIRCANDSLNISNNRFINGDGYGYGNNSPADYFAHTFTSAIMTPNDSHAPVNAVIWMSAYINLK